MADLLAARDLASLLLVAAIVPHLHKLNLIGGWASLSIPHLHVLNLIGGRASLSFQFCYQVVIIYYGYFWAGFGGLGFDIAIISGLGFEVWGFRSWVWGFECGTCPKPLKKQTESVSSLGFRVADVERIWHL